MGDLICAHCGEPWDAYGVFHGDMTPEEKGSFLKGEGCPCCFSKGLKAEHSTDWAASMLANLPDGFDGDPMALL